MKESQKDRILGYLEDECGGITPIEALNKFGCFRLADVVFKLRRDGYDIKTTDVHQNGKTFARYFLMTGERTKCPYCDGIFDIGEAADRRFDYGRRQVECPICGWRFDPDATDDDLIYEEVEREMDREYWRSR